MRDGRARVKAAAGGSELGMWLFLSRRLRSWLLFALVLPVAGRALGAVGVRVQDRSPRAGQALTRAGGLAQRKRRTRS